jgi:methylglutaconyl-CoA hydratase
MAEVRVERLGSEDEGIVLLGLDRPAAKNALGRELLREFREALATLRFDPTVRVVILHSLVPGVFCAGADLKERAEMAPPDVAAFVHGLRAAFTEVEDLPMPVLAAIEGAALGGGLELALACDLRVAGGDARLGLPETSLAIIPGAGGTQRLPRLIGKARAKELIFTGRRLSAGEAERLGLVEYGVGAGLALEKARALAREILPNGPIALRMAKQAVNRGVEVDRETGMAIEQACYAQVIPTQDRLEGLQAFREKRKPVYKGE